MRERLHRWLIVSTGALLLATTTHSSSARSPPGGTFDQRLQAAFNEINSLNISVIVGVAHGNEPTVYREFAAARSDGIPSKTTQVDINSVTKTVTAVMVLKLVQQGRLQLTDTIGSVFANVPANKAGITVHQLLTHAAGLVESVGSDEEPLTRAAFLKRAFQSTLLSAPGAKYNYSNAGYSILAAIIEVRSGKRYEEYLHEDVLAGLGFQNTGYAGVYDDSRSLRSADGRTIRQASWGGHDPGWNLIGNGGLISTVEEFIRFRRAVVAGEIIPLNLLKESQKKHIREGTLSSYYGYGLVVQNSREVGRFYWHDGGNDVFSAMWADFTEKGDLIFTAGAEPDSDNGAATMAMSVLLKHLYGIET